MKTPLLATALRRSLIPLVLALVLPASLGRAAANFSIPQLMTYQGSLTDVNGNPLGSTNTGPKNYDVVFRIWDLQSGGTIGASDEVDAEEQTVTVDNGYFSVLLGQGNKYANEPWTTNLASLFTNSTAANRYIEFTVRGIGVGNADVTIAPRLQLLPAPYAFLAASANNANYAGLAGSLVNSSNNAAVSVANNGYVGIGTASPTSALQVAGTVTATSFTGSGAGLTGVALLNGNNTFAGNQYLPGGFMDIGNSASGASLTLSTLASTGANLELLKPASPTLGYQFSVESGGLDICEHNISCDRLFIQNATGNVGIGTGSPAYALDVAGVGQFGGGVQVGEGINTGLYGDTGNIALRTYNNGAIFFQTKGGAATRMFISTNGYVGIGTTTPLGGLDVETAPLTPFGSLGGANGYLSSTGVGLNDAGSLTLAIHTSGSMAAEAYFAFSDSRIKNIIGVSSGARDLDTLRAIQVTDFTYRDTVTKGSGTHKKMVAQQVEKVFPEAVSKGTGVIPDIYKPATVNNGWVQLATDLKVGERVRLIGNEKSTVYEVLAVTNGSFRADLPVDWQHVFVYGREVNDLRTVDYDAVSMLNVSATQELARRIDEIDAREARVAVLEQKASKVDALEREVADLKTMVTQLAEAAKSSKLTAAAATGQLKTLATASLDH